MKTNLRNSRLKLLSGATIGWAVIFLGGMAQSVVAQATNTFPTSGNVGAGTTAPNAKLDVVGANGAANNTGAAAPEALKITGGTGGNGSWGGSGGGPGGAINLQAGTGGAPVAGSNSAIGGPGGAINLTGGTGGPNIFTIGGGLGGNVMINGGAGVSNSNGNVILSNLRGNVGIATLLPSYKLDVAGPVRSSAGGFIFPDGTVQISAAAAGGAPSQWVTSGTNIYYNSGNVGLGTGNPSYKFDVNGTVNATNFSINGSPLIGSQWTTNGTNINFSSGNVGIGTTNPGSKFEISGSAFIQRVTNTNANTYGALAFFEGATAKSHIGIIGSAANPATYIGGPNAFQIWNSANAPMVFGTNSVERIRIDSNGKVGIGTSSPAYSFDVNGGVNSFRAKAATTSSNDTIATFENASGIQAIVRGNGNVGIGTIGPAYRLDVQGGSVNASGGLCMAGDCKTSWSQVGGSQWTTSGATLSYNSGNVGIGTTSPIPLFTSDKVLHVAAGTNPHIRITDTTNSVDTFIDAEDTSGNIGTTSNHAFNVFTNNLPRVTVAADGNVGIGTAAPTVKLEVNGNTKITGNIEVTGTINAKYQDVAEWVPAIRTMPAGTVVVLNPTQSNQVMPSAAAYDTRVAGVVSARPGLALGEAGAEKVLVATTGRVLVKVDATRAPIHIGDLLVTSDFEGVAMKSEPLNLGGAQIHRPGTLIGKALEPLTNGRGEILVLLSLQ